MIIHPYAHGIDVSDNNGVIDWPSWHGHIDFAAIKVTEGLFWDAAAGTWTHNGTDGIWIDPQFKRNWDWAKELGLFRIAYHYGHTNANPATQARDFISVLEEQGFNNDDAVALDIEVADGATPIEVAFWASVFTHVCKRHMHGQQFLTYTFPAFGYAGNVAKQSGTGLWIANWGVPEPDCPPPWKPGRSGDWVFWQYASGGRNGVDRDIFHGDRRALAKWMKH